MIKGKINEGNIQVDDLLFKTNGGFDVFMMYLGKVGRVMARPWGKRETHKSWGIFPWDKVWFWKDHATEDTGNAIDFVQKYFNITFIEALEKIHKDLRLGTGLVSPITWAPPDNTDDYMHISFTKKSFTPKHHSFWNDFEVSEDYLQKMDCYAVKDLAINRKKCFIGKDEIVFAYYAPEEDGVKVYFPERDKDRRFRNNVSYHYLWNYSRVSSCDTLIVQKSFKDMIVTSLIEPCCIATQAEAIRIFDEETVQMINDVGKKTWIWYGSDWDGVKKCKHVTDTNKWKYINTPKNLLPDVNDAAGFVKMHNQLVPGSGLKELENFMKLKKLI